MEPTKYEPPNLRIPTMSPQPDVMSPPLSAPFTNTSPTVQPINNVTNYVSPQIPPPTVTQMGDPVPAGGTPGDLSDLNFATNGNHLLDFFDSNDPKKVRCGAPFHDIAWNVRSLLLFFIFLGVLIYTPSFLIKTLFFIRTLLIRLRMNIHITFSFNIIIS